MSLSWYLTQKTINKFNKSLIENQYQVSKKRLEQALDDYVLDQTSSSDVLNTEMVMNFLKEIQSNGLLKAAKQMNKIELIEMQKIENSDSQSIANQLQEIISLLDNSLKLFTGKNFDAVANGIVKAIIEKGGNGNISKARQELRNTIEIPNEFAINLKDKNNSLAMAAKNIMILKDALKGVSDESITINEQSTKVIQETINSTRALLNRLLGSLVSEEKIVKFLPYYLQ